MDVWTGLWCIHPKWLPDSYIVCETAHSATHSDLHPAFSCQSDPIFTRCFHLIIARGVASVRFTHLFIFCGIVVLFGNSLLVLTGADLLI